MERTAAFCWWLASLGFVGLACSGSAALEGCSGSKGSSGGASATGVAQSTLNANAFALTTEPTALDATSITFPANAETSSLQTGDVIVPKNASIAQPYLRHITGVAASGGSIVFQTVTSSLSELFHDANVQQTVSITTGSPTSAFDAPGGDSFDDITGIAPVTDDGDPDADTGALLMAKPRTLSRLRPALGLPTGLGLLDEGSDGGSGVITLPGYGFEYSLGPLGYLAPESSPTVVDMGESYFRLSGNLDFAYAARSSVDPLPDHLRLVLDGALALNIGAKITTEGAVSYLSPKVPYTSEDGVPLGTVIIPFGPLDVPVTIRVVLLGQAQVGTSGITTMHTAVNAMLKGSAGFDYTQASGVLGVSSLTKQFGVGPFSLQGQGPGGGGNVEFSLALYPLVAEVHFIFFGQTEASPYLSLNPYLGVSTDVSQFDDAGADAGADEAGGGLVTSSGDSPDVNAIYGFQLRLGGSIHGLSEDVSTALFDYSHAVPICSVSALICPAAQNLLAP